MNREIRENKEYNAYYRRGTEGYSVINKRKLQNLIEAFNVFAKKKVVTHCVTGRYDGYSYPILDRYIDPKDLRRMQKSKKLRGHKNYEELFQGDASYEEQIEKEALEWASKKYPKMPNNIMLGVIGHYKDKGRRLSREFLKRLPLLIRAHVRHQRTNYDSFRGSSESRKHERFSKNMSAEKIMREWQEAS